MFQASVANHNEDGTVTAQPVTQDDEEEQPPVQLDVEGEPFRHLEIWGLTCNYLASSDNNCSCHNKKCGEQVVVGDILRLKACIMEDEVNGELAHSVACILVRNGVESCQVGYVPTALVGLEMIQNNVNGHCQVVELFTKSKNKAKRHKSLMCNGVAGVIILGAIPQSE